MIRIASAQGFWGDWPQAPALQLRSGPIDYLVFDYLAEVTMSILQKQRLRDPSKGYATDFVSVLREVLPELLDKNVVVIANAGGVNPLGCAQALLDMAAKVVPGRPFKVGVVHGDNILEQVQELPLRGLDPAAPALDTLRDRLVSANVYLGAEPVVELLGKGCNVIVTGRVTDTGLTLAPVIHHFGVKRDDWNALATGIVAGHILECGAQSSGGNFLGRHLSVAELAQVGFPIAEFHGPGEFVVTKHEKLGGEVSCATVKEQLLYEIGDPKTYITPDVIADFSSIRVEPAGTNRVRVHGIQGRPATDSYKVSCAYHDGYNLFGTLAYSWPDATGKAKRAGELVRERARILGLAIDVLQVEIVGAGACHRGLVTEAESKPGDAILRIAARGHDEKALERLGREVIPLVLTGPSGATGFAGGRPRPSDILAYWPGLLDKGLVQARTEVFAV